MATLIGDGAHARDIAATLDAAWEQVRHHSEYKPDGKFIIIGINDPRVRASISRKLDVCDEHWIHPHAYLGVDSNYWYGTHIHYGVTMTRTTIGHHCTISPGVTICGDVTIGDEVLVGAGATICDRVTIGDGATIGAGAVVLPETIILDRETWVGVPARRV